MILAEHMVAFKLFGTRRMASLMPSARRGRGGGRHELLARPAADRRLVAGASYLNAGRAGWISDTSWTEALDGGGGTHLGASFSTWIGCEPLGSNAHLIMQ